MWLVPTMAMVAAATAACTAGSDGPSISNDPFDAGSDAPPSECRTVPDFIPSPPDDCPAGVEYCGVGDLDMLAWCTDGQVFTEAPSYYDYCFCGTFESACRRVMGQNTPPRLTCPGACLDEERHYFDSYEQYSSFAPESLCAPPDAGPPDAAP